MHRLRVPALAAGDLTVLLAARPDLSRLAADLASPGAWVARAGADGAAVTLVAAALWCVAAWVGLGLLAGAAAALPGTYGRIADRLARWLLPATVYRLVAGAAGFGVLLAPVAATAAAPPSGAVAVSVGRPAASAPTPGWPSDAPLPAPAWPTTAPRPTSRPAPPAAAPRPTTPPTTTPPPTTPHAAVRSTVIVQPGDSLWSITADHLPRGVDPARVARAWPRWFAANRAVIGDDPGLIRPGQLLHVPNGVSEHRS